NAGIEITFGPFGNIVQGNFIGVDVTGTQALGNGNSGVNIAGLGNPASIGNNLIGGTTAAARNIISANGQHGVAVAGQFEANDVVEGNFIGTDVTGMQKLGNGFSGVGIVDATNTTVGGTVAGAGNIIAHNAEIGVDVFGPTINNSILGNSIFDNGKLGIDLNARDGVTLNDVGDVDDGVNHLQNF